MAFTRRQFARLLQGGAAMIAAGFRSEGFGGSPFAAGGSTPSAGKPFDKRHFEALVGSRFRLQSSPDGPRFLTLLAVESLTRKPAPGKRATPQVECSTLRFSSEGAELPEGLYLLQHETAGAFPLYLNPGRPGRCLALLSLVPDGYLETVSIPRRAAKQIRDRAIVTT